MNNRKLLNIELGRVSVEEYKELPETGIVVVLDNIRSAHNVGSAFRTSDSFKIDKVWLCGVCAVPPSAEIHKSALGAEDSVAWEYASDTMDAVTRLKEEGYTVVCAEQTVGSVMLDGTPGEITFNLAHSNPQTEVFWHLDNEFITSTRHLHQLSLRPGDGPHTMTVIDEYGNRAYVSFTCYALR